tara:strand:+ start:325 stop:513 length:189 start_codon:yes stop_codon:yes gene_type:complete
VSSVVFVKVVVRASVRAVKRIKQRDGIIMALFGNTGGFWRRRLLKLVLLFGRAMMMMFIMRA